MAAFLDALKRAIFKRHTIIPCSPPVVKGFFEIFFYLKTEKMPKKD
jgi:hypothetical protein